MYNNNNNDFFSILKSHFESGTDFIFNEKLFKILQMKKILDPSLNSINTLKVINEKCNTTTLYHHISFDIHH